MAPVVACWLSIEILEIPIPQQKILSFRVSLSIVRVGQGQVVRLAVPYYLRFGGNSLFICKHISDGPFLFPEVIIRNILLLRCQLSHQANILLRSALV